MRRSSAASLAVALASALALGVAGAPPASAGGVAVLDVSLDAALRAGAEFSQSFSAMTAGADAATQVAVVEELDGNPGTIRAGSLRIRGASSVTGILRAPTVAGTYFLRLCLAPSATPTCDSAVASKVFAVDVAGPPVGIDLSPASRRVPADTDADVTVELRDAQGRGTQLATAEDLTLDLSATGGTPAATGFAAAVQDARDEGIGTFAIRNPSPATRTTIDVSPDGFVATAGSATLQTDPDPGSVVVWLDREALSARPGSTITMSGQVVDASGDPIASADVTGVVAGANPGSTSSATTGADGRFTVGYAASAAAPGDEDTVTISADAGLAGDGNARATVLFTPNGRTPISDLRFDGEPAASFGSPVDVAYDGIADVGDDAVAVTVVAAVPGETVTFRSDGGYLSAAASTPWDGGTSALTVASDTATGVATAYAFSVRSRRATITASASGSAAGDITFVSPREAARNVVLLAAKTTIRQGGSTSLRARVVDVFGNRVAEAVVGLSISGVGRFSTGQRQLFAATDVSGEAVVVVTSPRAGVMAVHAAGSGPTCEPGRNQYACAAGEPAAGMPAARSTSKARIRFESYAPAIAITAPRSDLPVSYNQWLLVRATTTDIAAGTRARLYSAGRLVDRAKVTPAGRLAFSKIRARGNGTFTIVTGAATARGQVRVREFGISSVAGRGGRLVFGVRTGAWTKGTRIVLTRNGTAVGSAAVRRAGSPLRMSASRRSGDYQVVVRTKHGPVPGHRPRFVP